MSALQPSDFYTTRNKTIFEQIKAIVEEGQSPDAWRVVERLGPKAVGEVGGIVYLSELGDHIISRSLLSYQIALLKEKTAKRKADQALYNISMDLFEMPLDEALVEIKRTVEELEDSVTKDDVFCSAKDASIEMLEYIQSFINGEVQYAETGFEQLDAEAPIQDEDLVIIGARPSVGKTALGLNIAKNVCLRGQKEAVAIISTEMSKKKLMMRLVSMVARRDFTSALRTRSEDIIYDLRFMNAISEVAAWPLYIMDKGRCTASEIANWIKVKKQEIEKRGLKLRFTIVDYLQNLKGEGESMRNLEVENAAKNLKQLSMDIRTPTIVLGQLGRDFEKRALNKGFKVLPVPSDLRDSGGAEQAADIIYLLHRPLVDSVPASEGCIVRSKVRDGSPGVTWVRFDGPTQTFEECGPHHDL